VGAFAAAKGLSYSRGGQGEKVEVEEKKTGAVYQV
jgi:hypothetical protein